MKTTKETKETKLITLFSGDATRRNGDYVSDVFFPFVDCLTNEQDILHTTISVLSAEIPHSFNNVTDMTKTVVFEIISSGVSATYSLNIPAANYNMRTFETAFETQFALGSHAKTCVLSTDTLTGKFKLNPGDPSFSIKILKAGTTADLILGLPADQTFTYSTTNPTAFKNPANFLSVTKLKLYSQALACSNFDSHNLSQSTLLDAISVNAPSYGLIRYENTSGHSSYLRNHTINGIDITIRDHYFRPVDFNNQEWSLTLVLSIYREANPHEDLTNSFGGLLEKQRRKRILDGIKENFKDAPILAKLEKKEKFEKEEDLSAFEDDDLEMLLSRN